MFTNVQLCIFKLKVGKRNLFWHSTIAGASTLQLKDKQTRTICAKTCIPNVKMNQSEPVRNLSIKLVDKVLGKNHRFYCWHPKTSLNEAHSLCWM